MSHLSWTNQQPSSFTVLPPARPYKRCSDPRRHAPLRYYLWEHRARVCGWCDPEHAYPRWGYFMDCLYDEGNPQLRLVQELRREEK